MNIYRHYKGNNYDYIGETEVGHYEQRRQPELIFEAIYTEDTEVKLKIIQLDTRLFSSWPEKLVIYVDSEGVIWARPYVMFHGYLDDGRKRFTLVTEQN